MLKIILLVFVLSPLGLKPQNVVQNIITDNHNYFIENKGQFEKNILFLCKLQNLNIFIEKERVVFDYYKIDSTSVKGHVVKMFHLNSKNNSKIIASKKLDYYHNYFLGNDSTKWAAHVNLYSEVVFENIYDGISCKFYFNNNKFSFEYLVDEKANYKDIKLMFQGQEDILINAESLNIKTVLGSLSFTGLQTKYKNNVVHTNWVKKENYLTFQISKSITDDKFIIDPSLEYSSFIGGNNSEYVQDIFVNSTNNMIFTGYTGSTFETYPVTSGAYDVTFAGSYDGVITKVSSTGTSLVFSTYIGGSATEYLKSLKLDATENIYVLGYTNSSNYPTTAGVVFPTVPFGVTGQNNIVLSKLNASGTALLYSTYYGGSAGELTYNNCLGVTATEEVYFCGHTTSSDFPFSSPHDQTYNGNDGFVVKLNSNATSTLFSTNLSVDALTDYAKCLTVDALNNVYVAIHTGSNGFVATAGAYDNTFNGGSWDVFIYKFNPSGVCIWGTYLGGNSFDEPSAIKVDAGSNIYIAGSTQSPNFPTTSGCYRSTINPKGEDGYITKMNSNASTLIFSTYLGASNNTGKTNILDMDIDVYGLVYVSGYTASTGFPLTAGAVDNTCSGEEGFVFKLNNTGSTNLYSTYFGSFAGNDRCQAISIDFMRDIYIGGNCGNDNQFPLFNSYDNSFLGGLDAFFAKIKDVALPISFVSTMSICKGDSIEVKWETLSEHNSSYFVLYVFNEFNDVYFTDTINAAGYSNESRTYASCFYNNFKQQELYYYIYEYDIDGNYEKFGPFNAENCDNSFQDSLDVVIDLNNSIVYVTSSNEQDYILFVYDNSGKLLNNVKFFKEIKMNYHKNFSLPIIEIYNAKDINSLLNYKIKYIISN